MPIHSWLIITICPVVRYDNNIEGERERERERDTLDEFQLARWTGVMSHCTLYDMTILIIIYTIHAPHVRIVAE